jgi:3-keto steroid reductase
LQFRELQDLLVKTPFDSATFDSAKVIWSSSLEASPKFYDSEDWQMTKTGHSYESSKYQIDIMATNLDRISLKSNEGKPIRRFVSEVCSTSISRALVSGILDFIKASFLFCQFPLPCNFFFGGGHANEH